MKKFILIFSLFTLSVSAQEPVGTIKIKREQNLVKAVFDNVEYKLMAIDRFGNPQENTFASYTLWIKEKKSTKKFAGYSNTLTPEMLKELKSLKRATKIFFTNIKVNGDDEHLVDLPDVIDTWFPDCANCIKKN
ncbi:MAG: hypothetical protein KBG47_06270 [Bacteroidia bacterium]|jgi:glycyl-tRNA synthetase beta subunit|nr:hypothetical protein [Bacteroidia bacterium]